MYDCRTYRNVIGIESSSENTQYGGQSSSHLSFLHDTALNPQLHSTTPGLTNSIKMADHLFGTSRPPPDPLKIEYHGPVYDGGPWLDYPSRQGWRRPADSRSGGTADKPSTLFIPESHNPRLECWLYFGVLHAVFGPSIQHNDFLRLESNGKRYLTTALLHRYVDVALKSSGKKNASGDPIIFGTCTTAAWESVENQLGSLLNNSDVRSLLRPEMQFAIRVLHATLFLLVKDTLGIKFRAVLLPQSACRDAWADERLRSSEKGWCPSEIACFSNLRSVLSQAYALQLRRPRTLDGRGGGDAHALCTAAKCRVNQVESGTYVTKHYPPECRCEHVVVPVEDVKAVLRRGGIPLVRIRGGGGEEDAVVLEVVAHRPGRNYVALSHVWSDGLGNAKVNSLPACQLRRLEAKAARLLWEHANVPGAWDNPVSALHVSGRHLLHAAMKLARNPEDDTLFWVDTLCVPLHEETRKMAIRGMKKVYERGK